jgi:choloylglycine hydrolase
MCTGIKINYDEGCIMGRTMDFEAPLNYNAIFLPRNYNYGFDLTGKRLFSKYKMMGMVFRNKDPLKDGVNEHGLVGITNDYSGFNLYSNTIDKEKLNISSLDYFNHALGNYRSVEELEKDLININLSNRNHRGESVLAPDFHFMFTDSTKRCIVVEPKRGKLVCYENPYDVMTNSPGFETHVKKLKQLMDIENLDRFNASKDLPGGYDPISRFIKAFYLTRMGLESKSSSQALSSFYSIMSAMTMPNGFVKNRNYNYTTYTRYTCAYDTERKLMTVKNDTNQMVYSLNFEDIADTSNRQAFFIEPEFTTGKLI